MQIAPSSFDTFKPPQMVYPEIDIYQTNEKFLRSGFAGGLHYVRRAMMMLWVDFHRTGSADESIGLLRSRVTPLKDIYHLSKRNGNRTNFDMEYGLAAVLTADHTTIDTFVTHALAYGSTSGGYGFYTGFVGILKGLLTADHRLIQEQRQPLEKLNPSKMFYWPTKAVIFATLDGDCAKLSTHISKINQKFTGYVQKMEALDEHGHVDLNKLDPHFFCPYSDLAFYALACGNCPGLMKKDSFWLPKALVEACGDALVKR